MKFNYDVVAVNTFSDFFEKMKRGYLFDNIKLSDITYRELYDYTLKMADSAVKNTVLGICLVDGKGVPKNETSGVSYLIKASKNNNVQAQYKLACCYLKGIGVPKDENRAVKLFNQAAVFGYLAHAQYQYARCYQFGIGIGKDYQKAFHWYSEAANQGLAIAYIKLGYCYANQIGVPRNYKDALINFKIAAANGYAKQVEATINALEKYFE